MLSDLSTDRPPTWPMIQLFGSTSGHRALTANRGEPIEPGAAALAEPRSPLSGSALLRSVLAANKIVATSAVDRPRLVISFVRNGFKIVPPYTGSALTGST